VTRLKRDRLFSGLLTILLVTALLAGCGPAPQPDAAGPVLLAEVYVNGHARDGSDQFIRLHNAGPVPVELAGWSIGDQQLRATFPAGAMIGARQSLYLARDGAAFRGLLGAPPDYAWATAEQGQKSLKGGSALVLGQSSGMVMLIHPDGESADILVYGTVPPNLADGWRGPALPTPSRGEVMDRARDEARWTESAPGTYVRDTDSAADWKQGNSWYDGRILRPGQTWFGLPTYPVRTTTVYASPDSAYATFTAALDQARRSIDINLYDFTLVPVAEKLAAAALRGVQVRLLMESGTGARPSDQERYMAKVVHEAGGEVRWMVSDTSAGVPGRYVFNHAKYTVVDGRVSMVQSENMVRHGTPVDPSFGNRGWGAVVEDQALAAYLSRVFEADWNPGHGDIMQYQEGSPFGPPKAGFVPETGLLTGSYPHPFPALTLREPVAVSPILAPEHTLLKTKGIIGLMRSARESLLVEQQYIQMNCA